MMSLCPCLLGATGSVGARARVLPQPGLNDYWPTQIQLMTSDAPVVLVIVAVVVLVDSIWTGFALVVMSSATQRYEVVAAKAVGNVMTAAFELSVD